MAGALLQPNRTLPNPPATRPEAPGTMVTFCYYLNLLCYNSIISSSLSMGAITAGPAARRAAASSVREGIVAAIDLRPLADEQRFARLPRKLTDRPPMIGSGAAVDGDAALL